jgi:hypothetical protein
MIITMLERVIFCIDLTVKEDFMLLLIKDLLTFCCVLYMSRAT